METSVILDFIIKLLGILVWPVVVLIVIFTFKNGLTDILARINSIEKDGSKFKLDIQKKLHNAGKSIQKTDNADLPENIDTLVNNNPKVAIGKSWDTLFASAMNAAQSGTDSGKGNISLIGDSLRENGILNKDEEQAFYVLEFVHDQAEKGLVTLSDMDSYSYASTAYALSNKIKKANKNE